MGIDVADERFRGTEAGLCSNQPKPGEHGHNAGKFPHLSRSLYRSPLLA
jgi:hypothetical protein